MKVTISRLSTALLFTAVCAGANAEYRCAPAPNWMDRDACKAAEQGPDALRRFVQRMSSIRINLQFSDYVDARTAQGWGAKPRQTAERKDTIEDTRKVASSD
jgi:hypothetical protein